MQSIQGLLTLTAAMTMVDATILWCAGENAKWHPVICLEIDRGHASLL